MNRATIAISKWLIEEDIPGYICAQVHDEIVVHVEEKYASVVAEKMQYIMENIYKLDVSLKAPAEIGNRYGDIK